MRKLAALIALVIAAVAPVAAAHAQGAMIYGTDTATSPPTPSLPTSNDLWFTNGNGGSIIATQVPDYFLNKVGGEINYAITASGQTLNMSNYTQLWQAIANAATNDATLNLTVSAGTTTVNLTTAQAAYASIYVEGAPGASVTILYPSSVTRLAMVGNGFTDGSAVIWKQGVTGGYVTQPTGTFDLIYVNGNNSVFEQKNTVPTASAGTDTTQPASTAFVQNALSALLGNGNSWSGAQTFAGGAFVPNRPAGDNTTNAASTTYALAAANTAQSNAETYAASQATTAQSNAEAYAASQAATAQSNAETYANGTNSLGTTFGSNGYTILPGGLIIEWGSVTLSGPTSVSWSFPQTLNHVFVVEATACTTGTFSSGQLAINPPSTENITTSSVVVDSRSNEDAYPVCLVVIGN